MKYYAIYRNGNYEWAATKIDEARKYCKEQVSKRKRSLFEIFSVLETKNRRPKLDHVADVYYTNIPNWNILYLDIKKKKNYRIRSDGSLGEEY